MKNFFKNYGAFIVITIVLVIVYVGSKFALAVTNSFMNEMNEKTESIIDKAIDDPESMFEDIDSEYEVNLN